MPIQVITQSNELHKLAQHIIRAHHTHLTRARILYLFTTAKTMRAGRLRTGVAKRLGPEQRFLSSGLESVEEGYDFMVVVNKTQWDYLTDDKKIALLDHELCHCKRVEKVNRRTGVTTYKWATRGHDVEEFAEIVQRHGLWNVDVKRLVTAGAQLALDDAAVPEGLPEPIRETVVAQDGLVESTRLANAGEASTSESAEQQVTGTNDQYGTMNADGSWDVQDLEDVTEESGDIAQEDVEEQTDGSAVPEPTGRHKGSGIIGRLKRMRYSSQPF